MCAVYELLYLFYHASVVRSPVTSLMKIYVIFRGQRGRRLLNLTVLIGLNSVNLKFVAAFTRLN